MLTHVVIATVRSLRNVADWYGIIIFNVERLRYVDYGLSSAEIGRSAACPQTVRDRKLAAADCMTANAYFLFTLETYWAD